MRLQTPLGALALAGTALAATGEPQKATLKYRAVKTWSYILPAEQWTAVSDIPIPHANGEAFATMQSGLSLKIDTDADGKLDKTVKGMGGFAVLRGQRAGGGKFTYAVRIARPASRYEFASSGVMTGSIAGTKISLIDQNNNGTYNEVGVDAIVVGSGKSASFLSEIVNLKGELYRFEANAPGAEISVEPYQGDAGTLSMKRGFRGSGMLLGAVVKKDGEDVWFEISSQAVKVPTGTYRFVAGLAQSAGETAKLVHGKMAPLVVGAEQTVRPTLGKPLMVEFNYTREGAQVTVHPDVHFYGRSGEEWHTILPELKSPKLSFYDKETGKLLTAKRFEQC